MYQGLVDGLGAVAHLQYQIQEARRSMLYALTTTDSNRQVEYADRSRGADARVAAITSRLAPTSDTGEGRGLLNALDRAWTAYLTSATRSSRRSSKVKRRRRSTATSRRAVPRSNASGWRSAR